MTPGIASSGRARAGEARRAAPGGGGGPAAPPPHIGLASARSAIRRSVSLPAESRREPPEHAEPARRH